MKDTVIDVLMYLFESYMDEENDVEPDRETAQAKLLEAGFPHTEIEKAFDWLESLSDPQDVTYAQYPGTKAMRMYTNRELEKLDRDCHGFLLFLEQTGVLSPATREMVIDRVTALETEEISLENLKWVILMVLFNMPGEEAAYSWLEDLVMEEPASYLH
ncbi:MAG: DUF494 family protein [Gammaproteobacteria bacterium]